MEVVDSFGPELLSAFLHRPYDAPTPPPTDVTSIHQDQQQQPHHHHHHDNANHTIWSPQAQAQMLMLKQMPGDGLSFLQELRSTTTTGTSTGISSYPNPDSVDEDKYMIDRHSFVSSSISPQHPQQQQQQQQQHNVNFFHPPVPLQAHRAASPGSISSSCSTGSGSEDDMLLQQQQQHQQQHDIFSSSSGGGRSGGGVGGGGGGELGAVGNRVVVPSLGMGDPSLADGQPQPVSMPAAPEPPFPMVTTAAASAPPPPAAAVATTPAMTDEERERRTKKMQHNAVERKYRNSINSRLEELKELLSTTVTSNRPGKKLNKASVLNSAIMHIRQLREANARLENDNRHLCARMAKIEGGEEGGDIGAKIASGNSISASTFASTAMDATDRPLTTSLGVAAAAATRSAALSPTQSSDEEVPSSGQEMTPPGSPEEQVASAVATVSSSPPAAAAAAAAAVPPPRKRKKPHSEEYVRMFMAAGLFGLCVFGSPAWLAATTDPAADPSSIAHQPAHHASRVLASVQLQQQQQQQYDADAAYATGSDLGSATLASYTHFWGWVYALVLRAVLAFVGLYVLFSGETLATEPAKARAAWLHERKSKAVLAKGDHQTAHWHVTQALLFLGRPQASSALSVLSSLAWESLCQLSHRLAVHRSLRTLLMRAPPVPYESLHVAALATHCLQQLLLRQHVAATTPEERAEAMQRARLAAVQAVNLVESGQADSIEEQEEQEAAADEAETYGADKMGTAPLRVRVYVAAAAQAILSSGEGSWLAGLYLRQAQRVAHRRTAANRRPSSLAWVFHQDGHAFLQSGKWTRQRMLTPMGQALAPGELEQLGLAYRRHTLGLCVAALVRGDGLELISERLGDLLQHSANAGDTHTAWWAHVIASMVHWRQGRTVEAAAGLDAAVALEQQHQQRQQHQRATTSSATATTVTTATAASHRRPKRNFHSRLQAAVLAACEARRALLEGHQPRSWVALSHALRLLSADGIATLVMEEVRQWGGDVSGSNNNSAAASLDLARGCVFMALRQLLACRLALYRLRSHLAAQRRPVAPLAHANGANVTGQDLLDTLRSDVTLLGEFAQGFPLAQPLAHMYRAVHRCLVGGRARPTEHLFRQALASARRQELHFDTAYVRLHLCCYMRPTLTVADMRKHLGQAARVFERVDAAGERITARKMLAVMDGDS